ncbi:VanZ family protein [Rathayibacter sp. VKM Ac-2754]|uniref:VanZ family protein n=1 Tax=Rathayibacter sp. VKM Ac-2754 TaxID=2609251 RepID=UPI00135B6618|nr:VanZ family protein [Rathayibacter sp. VKM Ac-2754]MWV60023.1 VanZ family protein [Rathayibacter sp. VKM Ac-2754]
MPRSLTRLIVVVGALYLAALTAIVFWPTPVDASFTGVLARLIAWLGRRGLGWIDYGVIESGANVLLFVPFGLLGALLLRARWAWLAIVLAAATSTAIETAQLLLLSARYSSTQDVLMNTLGATLGAAAGIVLRAWLTARERRRAAESDLAFAHIPLRSSSGVVGDQ